jgi:hypothetical protein
MVAIAIAIGIAIEIDPANSFRFIAKPIGSPDLLAGIEGRLFHMNFLFLASF